MKELVQGQKIRIDNHRRGAGGIDYYDDPANDIHLDKTVYDGRKQKESYQIRVPLNSNRPVTVNREENFNVPKKILDEIQKAFDDGEKRNRFVDEMREVLRHYPIKNEKNVSIDRVYDALKRIADGFDLGWRDDQIKKYSRTTKTKGTKYIALLTKHDYTYYLAFETEQYVVADFKKVGHRYVGEWIRV